MKNKSVNKGDPRMCIGTQRYRCVCMQIHGVPLCTRKIVSTIFAACIYKGLPWIPKHYIRRSRGFSMWAVLLVAAALAIPIVPIYRYMRVHDLGKIMQHKPIWIKLIYLFYFQFFYFWCCWSIADLFMGNISTIDGFLRHLVLLYFFSLPLHLQNLDLRMNLASSRGAGWHTT